VYLVSNLTARLEMTWSFNWREFSIGKYSSEYLIADVEHSVTTMLLKPSGKVESIWLSLKAKLIAVTYEANSSG